MPSQILIAEKIPKEEHGKVYGAHFAWSHLWWAFGYPIAGYVGIHYQKREFLIGAGLSILLLLMILLLIYPKQNKQVNEQRA